LICDEKNVSQNKNCKHTFKSVDVKLPQAKIKINPTRVRKNEPKIKNGG